MTDRRFDGGAAPMNSSQASKSSATDAEAATCLALVRAWQDRAVPPGGRSAAGAVARGRDCPRCAAPQLTITDQSARPHNEWYHCACSACGFEHVVGWSSGPAGVSGGA